MIDENHRLLNAMFAVYESMHDKAELLDSIKVLLRMIANGRFNRGGEDDHQKAAPANSGGRSLINMQTTQVASDESSSEDPQSVKSNKTQQDADEEFSRRKNRNNDSRFDTESDDNKN